MTDLETWLTQTGTPPPFGACFSKSIATPVAKMKAHVHFSLFRDFIFEVAHGGGEASVQGHVGVADEA